MDSLKDEKSVFQNDSILKVILTMAVPTVISQMMTVLFNYLGTANHGFADGNLKSDCIKNFFI